MSRFDVHANPGPSGREDRPYVVVIQTNLLNDLPTRICAPLFREGAFKPQKRVNPSVEVLGRTYYFSPTEIVTLPVRLLGKAIANLEDHRDRMIDAMGFVLLGI